jgi:hypothetical protein
MIIVTRICLGIDNTAAGPGAFTGDLDDLPSSNPIPDSYSSLRQFTPGPHSRSENHARQ